MFFKDLFTEKDGASFCPVRAGYILGFLFILIITSIDLFNGQHFMEHAKDWVTGIAQYISFGGAAVAGKNWSEKE